MWTKLFSVRNILTSPNSRMDLEAWGIAESEALWSCEIRCLMGRHTHSPYTKQVILTCKPFSQFLTGVLCGEQSSRKSPRFVLSLYGLAPPWHRFLLSCAHPSLLCFEFTNRVNLGWKILGIPPSQFCNPYGYYSSKLSLKASYFWKWITLCFFSSYLFLYKTWAKKHLCSAMYRFCSPSVSFFCWVLIYK